MCMPKKEYLKKGKNAENVFVRTVIVVAIDVVGIDGKKVLKK